MKYNMKHLTIVLAGSALLLSGCTKKIDEAFANPNALTKQPIEALLPGVISNMAIQHSANGTLYGPQNDGLYIGRFIQNWSTNITGNQYDQMGDNFINKSDVMGSIWAMHYYGMGANISRIIEWGTDEKKWDYVGVAQALRAWSWVTLTDIHDDVILREAFRPEQLVFKYDPQADVYAEALRLCEELKRTDSTGRDPLPSYYQGIYYSTIKAYAAAIQSFDRTILIDYNFIEAYIEKTSLLYDQKNFKGGLEVLSKALAVAPDHASVYYWTAKCQQALGDKESARFNYLKAYGLDKSFSEAKAAADQLK